MKTKICFGFLVILFASAFVWHQRTFGVISLDEVPKLLSSMRAKEFCSCHFMLGNEEDYCLKRVLKGYPLFEYSVDKNAKSVTFSNHLAQATASVNGSRLGCKLE